MAVLHCHCMGYYSNPLCHHEGEKFVILSLKPQDVWQTRITSANAAITLLYETQDLISAPSWALSNMCCLRWRHHNLYCCRM